MFSVIHLPAVCGVFQLDLALGLTLSHPPFPTSLQGSADMDPGDARDLLTGMVHSVSGTWPYAHGHTAPLTYPVPGTRLLAALQTHPPHSHWGHRCPSLPLSGGTPDHSLYQVAAQPDLLQTTAFHDVHLCCCLLLATSSVLRGDSPQIRHLDPGGLQMKEEVPSHQAPDESRW